MTGKILVLTTAGSELEARTMARGLIEQHLAACVNLIPQVHSLYWWQGQVESSTEYLLLIKTLKSQEDRVRAAIRELHSYQLPECIVMEIHSGSEEYLKWMEEAVAPRSRAAE
ncbi:MAG: divalent-cation tolerance protein CutA [Acidobacteria bacterium]|nr:divalent-cation tolerance protein CutA [Acidobacteriota bacterium]